MRALTNEDLTKFLEDIKDRLNNVASKDELDLESKTELYNIVDEIKDTLYWI